jgi:hypothetical protein
VSKSQAYVPFPDVFASFDLTYTNTEGYVKGDLIVWPNASPDWLELLMVWLRKSVAFIFFFLLFLPFFVRGGGRLWGRECWIGE